MSPLEAIRAVMASSLPAAEAHVLMCWASHVNAEGVAWPSARTLAGETGMTDRGVRNLLHGLEGRGVLVLDGRTTVGGKRHRLDLGALAAVEPALKQDRRAPRSQVRTPEPHSDPGTTFTPLNSIPDPPEQHSGPPLNSIPGGAECHSDEEDKKRSVEEDMEEDRAAAPQPSPDQSAGGLPLTLTSPKAKPPDAWTVLADAYGALPGCMRPRDRRKGNGTFLRTLLDHHGLDLAILVLRWWAYDRTEGGRAAFLRAGGHKLATLATAKNVDTYAEMASEWAAKGRPGDPDAEVQPRPRALSVREQRARDLAEPPPPPFWS